MMTRAGFLMELFPKRGVLLNGISDRLIDSISNPCGIL
jgi:hypothetical protein